ncbi:MAG: pantoate--beta-alanine ligase [Deltaproteobacteria bacterium]|nr:pantoate--beta-alanine ligase [Deltaproteobacteria bacterium]
MDVFRTIEAMNSWRKERWRSGQRIGLVPTMGYLHPGHLALMEEALRRSDEVVVSIFVNPTQFSPGEDLDDYPRDMARDLELCRALGVHVVFAPEGAEMYGPGFQTKIIVEELSKNLCGRYRANFFTGVATVVAKLFCIVQPHLAVFGEKDFQQLVVVKRLSQDLNLGVEIIAHPTVREPDGLAMSSRNQYLSAEERRSALSLYKALLEARELVAGGERSAKTVIKRARAIIEAQPHTEIQYVQVVDEETMVDLDEVTDKALMAIAVFVGKARLIDNMRLWPDRS